MMDVLIIGGGPAGLTCGIYCARAGYETVVLERMMSGGQMALTSEIENYPGIQLIDGMELSMDMESHAKKCGVTMMYGEVQKVELEGKVKKVITSQGEMECRSVVFATGARRRELGVPGEKELAGRGVSYCATCDGGFFRGKTTAVVGGGNTALEDALYLSKICQKVYLIHRRDSFRGEMALQRAVKADPKIEILYNAQVEAISGSTKVENITVVQQEGKQQLLVDGVFIAVGMQPVTELLKDSGLLDEQGYVKAGEDCRTAIPGVYAIGDLRTKQVRQVITAAADGAVAAAMAAHDMMENGGQ